MQEALSVLIRWCFASVMLKLCLKCIIFSSEYMCEFIDFCPFSTNHLSEQPEQPSQPLLGKKPSSANSETGMTEMMAQPQTISSEVQRRQGSLNHNLVKQLIITIKQMVGPSVRRIASGELNRTVQAIWQNLINHPHANKEILKALFDQSITPKLLAKYGFTKIVDEHGADLFKEAVYLLKEQMLFVMKNESIKSHLLDRKVQNKERLEAFVLYFLHEELRKGRIANRQGERATKEIEKMLKYSREQDVFVDRFFSSEEVFERFASQNNEIS